MLAFVPFPHLMYGKLHLHQLKHVKFKHIFVIILNMGLILLQFLSYWHILYNLFLCYLHVTLIHVFYNFSTNKITFFVNEMFYFEIKFKT